MPVDHTVSQFSLVDAPNSWPAINSLPGLTVYPGEIIYFDVKYAPAENNPPFEVWISSPSGANEQGTTVPGEAYLGANSSILGTGSYWQSTRGVFAWRNSWYFQVPSNTPTGPYYLRWEGADSNQPIYPATTGGWWNHLTGFRAAYILDVQAPLVCELDAPVGTLTITIAPQAYNTYSQLTTATLSGLTPGANCNMQDRRMTSAVYSQGSNLPGWINSPTPPNLRSYSVIRGTPYTFQAKHAERTDNHAVTTTATPPYIPADSTITMVANNYNTSDGLWTATFTGIAHIGNVYQVKIAGHSEFGFWHPDLEAPLVAYPPAFGTGILN